MKVNDNVKPVIFEGECDYESQTLSVRPSNMGEPFRSGADFDFQTGNNYISVFLESSEVRRIRDFLNDYTGKKDLVEKAFTRWLDTEDGLRSLRDGRFSQEITQEEALQKAYHAGSKARG